MRDIGEERAAPALAGLERLGHLVEGRGQIRDLLGPLHGDPRLVVAPGDAPRGVGERPDRPRHANRKEGAHRDRGHERRRDGEPERHEHGVRERLVEVAADALGQVPDRPPHVRVEDPRRQGERHERERRGARDDDERLGQEEPRGEPAQPPAPSHSPVPIRYPTPRTVLM